MKYYKDKFYLKVYDAHFKKTTNLDVNIPDSLKRVPTLHFSYVNCANEIILSGGQFKDDKTCSIDNYRIDINTG